MKVPLRIIVLLLSIGILITAALPPKEAAATVAPDETGPVSPSANPTDTPTRHTDPNLIRDFLGGAQLDAGAKAKEVLNSVQEDRIRDIGEL